MNTRLRFKLIAALITLSLAGLVVFQGYWLHGLYKTLYAQMEVNICEAMKIADYKELFLRVREELNKKETLLGKTRTITVYSDPLSSLAQDSMGMTPSSSTTSTTLKIDYSDEDGSTPLDSTLTDYLTAISQLENHVLQAFHIKIDPFSPIVYSNYNRFLKEELNAKNISTEYKLVVAGWQGEDIHTISATNEDSVWCEGATYFDHPIQSGNSSFYRLYFKSPASIILKQMSGILVSSIALLVLIVISFVYLLRTILRQRTVEELKTDFTNNMTHELKTPISVSYAAVDALLNFGEPVSGKQRKYLAIIKDQLTHLTGLVEQILTLAVENRSTFRLRLEQINLLELVNLLIEQYKLKANKKIEFVVDVPESIELRADRTHLYNIMSNLIENAVKYGDKEPYRIILKATKDSHSLHLTVEDNGIGIPETYRQQIFEKFFRIPNGNLHNVKGYGLGLYYVKDMMTKHGGSVTVESHLGKGSAFTLHFPI